jgi:putative ABC transport system permease protein
MSATRALTRVAWRDLTRHRGRSLLVILLIALPVAAMVGGAAIYRTTQISQDRQDVNRMGRADLLSYAFTEAEITPYLPTGSTIERVVQMDGRLVLDTGRPGIDVRVMKLDGLAHGMLTLLAGREPSGAAEVAISPAVAALAKTGIGGSITVDGRASATVVGLIENPSFLPDRAVLIDPATVKLSEDAFSSWLIDLPDGVDPAAVVDATLQPGTEVQDVDLQTRGPGRLVGSGDDSTSTTILVLGALALIQSALIASAAFAVSIRRRQRELGLLAATGATNGQLAQSVLLAAGMLGLVACVVGVGLGLAGALGLTPFLDGLTEHRNGSLVVGPSGLIGPVAVGLIASLVAAVIPAFSAARIPVLLALSGRRPSPTPARRTLWVGLAAIGASVVMTAVGATMHSTGDLNLVMLIGGAVLGTLGFGATSPWLLERLEVVTSRMPVAGRLAFRDTARARSRSSPIVTAVLCALAAAVAIGAYSASRDAEALASWTASLPADELVVVGPSAAKAGAELLAQTGVIGGMDVPALVSGASGAWPAFTFPDARDNTGKLINTLDECENCNPGAFQPYQISGVAASTPELLKLAHAEAGAADLASGTAVLLTAQPMTATVMDITFYDNDTGDVTRKVILPVRVIDVGVRGPYLPEAFLPDSSIADLGLAQGGPDGVDAGTRFVVQYDHPVTDGDLGRAQVIAAKYPDTVAQDESAPVRPGEGFRMLIIGLVLLFAVSVTGIAIALGEAESRPEQRSLLVLGADPRLRRRIAASRAAILGLLSGILAVPAGLLPVWGIFLSRGTHLEIPTLEIAGSVLVLPLVAIAGAFLLSRPIPEWNAFRTVRSGE